MYFLAIMFLSRSLLYVFSGDNVLISIFSVDKYNEISSKMVACQNRAVVDFDVITAGEVPRF